MVYWADNSLDILFNDTFSYNDYGEFNALTATKQQYVIKNICTIHISELMLFFEKILTEHTTCRVGTDLKMVTCLN